MTNPMRTCIGCAGIDDHPRHVLVGADHTEITWHMDCHVIATNCPECTTALASANGAQGDELRNHLMPEDG